jgi:DNA-binding GntR family transcriptional regulator
VHTNAYEKLKLLLATSQLRPDEHLKINELAGHLNVGVTPLREALIRLASEGLITLHPKRGFFAKAVTIDELRELYHFAYCLLRSSLLWGTARISTEGLRAELARDLSDVQDGQYVIAATRAIEQLYEKIAALSGIGEMSKVIRNYSDRTRAVRLVYVEQIEQVESTTAFVLMIADLLEANDREKIVPRLQQRFEAKTSHLPRLVKEVASQAFSSQWRDYAVEPPSLAREGGDVWFPKAQGALRSG